MSSASSTIAGKAKLGGTQDCGPNRKELRNNAAILRCARRLWPRCTAANLAAVTGFPIRTCEYWLQKEFLPAEALATLCRSQDHGREFLAAMMAGTRWSWWLWIEQQFSVLDARRLERAARRRLKEAIDADRDVSAAIAAAEAYFVESDPEFYGHHADALRAAGGPLHRALAAQTKRR